MKLCSICDKKIEGTWCKTCHRFVKTYELPGRIYLNESHNPLNDKDCTYHTATQTYRQSATATRTSTATASTGTSTPKKKPKVVAIIIVCYLIFMCLSVIIPIISNLAREVSSELKDEFRNNYESDDSFLEDDEGDSEADALFADMQKKTEALEDLDPEEVLAEEDYEFSYYDPDDIKDLGFSCSEEHFDWDVSEFEDWLDDYWTDDYETEEISSSDYNYYYVDEDIEWLYFATFRDYYATDDFAVRAGYDTGSEELHMFGFASTEDADYTDLFYQALRKTDPKTKWTKSYFVDVLYETLEAGEAITFYASDAVEIDMTIEDGYYSVTFYPAYTE